LSRQSIPTTPRSVLLVSPPGLVEEALRAAIASLAGVEIIAVVTGCLSASHALRRLAPNFVLISGQIPAEEIVTLIEQLGEDRQAARAIVLSSSQGLEQQFLAAGAFAVLAPWEPVDRLQAVIQRDGAIPGADEVYGHGIRS
jgi:DNA-binding NarL/FixJ family response regulator